LQIFHLSSQFLLSVLASYSQSLSITDQPLVNSIFPYSSYLIDAIYEIIQFIFSVYHLDFAGFLFAWIFGSALKM